MCVSIYIVPVLINLSIFLSVFKVSSKEIKLLRWDSNFMRTWFNCPPQQKTLDIILDSFDSLLGTFLRNHFQLSNLS